MLILLTLLGAVIPTIIAYINARVIDGVIKAVQSGISLESFFTLGNPTLMILMLSILVSSIAFVIKIGENYFNDRYDRIHLHVFENSLNIKISNLDVADFEDSNKSDVIKKATDNIYQLSSFFSLSLTVLTEGVATIISGVLILQFNPLLFLLVAITAVPGIVFFWQYIIDWQRFYDTNIHTIRKKWWLISNVTFENSVPENRVLNANGYLIPMLNRITNWYYGREMELNSILYKKQLLAYVADLLREALSLAYLVAVTIIGRISVGDLSFYQSQLSSFSHNLDYMLSNTVSLFDKALKVEHIRNIFLAENKIVSGNVKLASKNAPKIEFVNVSFKYPNTKKWAIKNLSIKIDPTEEIAIVGENGAGKTTFLKLLLRFYDPTKGKILVNGKDIRTLDLHSYYSRIGALFQDFNTYYFLTIYENIVLGKRKNFRKINESLKMAEAYDFVQRLEKKGNHELSKQFKHGTKLSTGQRQKIALARMFYRDAPILILDEPTASIDAISEYKIFNRIYRFTKNKTVIIVSHRFSTVRNAQKIYVFDKAKIIEQGSHEELLKLNGKYAEAFKLQAQGYVN